MPAAQFTIVESRSRPTYPSPWIVLWLVNVPPPEMRALLALVATALRVSVTVPLPVSVAAVSMRRLVKLPSVVSVMLPVLLIVPVRTVVLLSLPMKVPVLRQPIEENGVTVERADDAAIGRGQRAAVDGGAGDQLHFGARRRLPEYCPRRCW